MRKMLLSVFFLMIPLSAWAWTTTNNFNTLTTADGWHNWSGGKLGTVSITSDQYVSSDPGRSLQIECGSGFPDSGVPGGVSFVFPSPTKEFWMQYYFKYSSNYQFHSVGNKQVYIWDATGSTYMIGAYQWGSPRMMASFTHKTPIFYPNTGYDPTINRARWYKIVIRVKMVSEGNDILQMWIDDRLAMDYRHTTLPKLGYSQAGFTKVAIDPVWGGQANPPVPKAATDWQWYDHVIVSTDPILVGYVEDVDGGTIKQPSFPKSVSIK